MADGGKHSQKRAIDYYPFGLTFNSSFREGGKENRYLFNSQELQDDLGLNMFMYQYRSYDPALGRWWQIDEIDKEDLSPYAWVTNNPILYADFLGLDSLNSNDPNFSWDNVKPGDYVDGVEVLGEVTTTGTYTGTKASDSPNVQRALEQLRRQQTYFSPSCYADPCCSSYP